MSYLKPKSKKVMAKVEVLTVAEQKELITVLEKIDHKYKHIILLALYTGMRIGEILALTRDNVNLKDNTLTIERTLTRDKNDKVILGSTTKTSKGKRTIYLSNNAVSVLKEVMKNNILNTYNLVFFDYTKNTFNT